ncbi:MAG: hypothetical protein A2Y95_03835 [Deltaproteobacteria bacterium RBG_13_65_10]|jgi:hypothetical protein|nr:MAG: hypothetical protein A2Y95_03835 [Deltaproteobacteria bacterium RBG_13_65_10]
MEARLTFEYDELGDILYIRSVPPYPEQETEQLAYNVFARRNPRSGAIEGIEILFFTQWLLKEGAPRVKGLGELFAGSRSAAHE